MPYLQPRSAHVTLDANGNGQAALSIDNTNQRWLIDYVTVQTTQAQTQTPIPQAKTYKNVVAPQGFQGGTNSGNMDTSSGLVVLYPDDVFYVLWSGGPPGVVATVTIAGRFDPAGMALQD